MHFFTDIIWNESCLPAMFRYLTIIAYCNIPTTRMDLHTFLDLVNTLISFQDSSNVDTVYQCLHNISRVLFMGSLETGDIEVARGTFISILCQKVIQNGRVFRLLLGLKLGPNHSQLLQDSLECRDTQGF